MMSYVLFEYLMKTLLKDFVVTLVFPLNAVAHDRKVGKKSKFNPVFEIIRCSVFLTIRTDKNRWN
jgi:hypothetical protein